MTREFMLPFILVGWLNCAAADGIVVAVYSQSGVALAADSRQVDQNTGAITDSSCKLLTLSDSLVFAAVGQDLQSSLGNATPALDPEWTYIEARAAFRRFRRSVGASIEDPAEGTAQLWKQAVQKVLEDTFAAHPNAFLQMPQGGFLLRALFAGLNRGKVSLLQVSVKPKVAPRFEIAIERITPTHELATLAIGRTAIVDEFSAARSERARMEASQRERESKTLTATEHAANWARRLVDLTFGLAQPGLSAAHVRVGGPIDLLELKPGQRIRWIQEKPHCNQANSIAP